ncbi:RepA protein, partial [Rhodocytophaga aerolata]
LSKPAQKVCAYVMSITEFNDRIIFELDDCKKFTGYTSNEAVYKGLTELLDNEMIARASASNLFFINPQVFYKGDRIVLLTEYRKRSFKKMSNPNQADLFETAKE